MRTLYYHELPFIGGGTNLSELGGCGCEVCDAAAGYNQVELDTVEVKGSRGSSLNNSDFYQTSQGSIPFSEIEKECRDDLNMGIGAGAMTGALLTANPVATGIGALIGGAVAATYSSECQVIAASGKGK